MIFGYASKTSPNLAKKLIGKNLILVLIVIFLVLFLLLQKLAY
jgi:hypothetical protein